MRALFLVPWPAEAASTRLRVEQYFPFLREHGVEPILRPFMSPRLYGTVYEPGHVTRKTILVGLSSLRRLLDVVTAARADVVFIHREAFPFGTTILERAIAALGVPTVLDFDDAIYLPTNSDPNGFVRHLKRPGKVERLIRSSRAVVVGNHHLQQYARQFNAQVVVLPTPVDTTVYTPRPPSRAGENLVIGWIGSGTTSRYLNLLREPLARVLERHPNVSVTVMGGWSSEVGQLPRVTRKRWSLAGELQTLHEFDIGLMPYPDNEWAKGKCAFKALLYMSVGIPAVCSAVGMAGEIVESGETGYLASREEDWFAVLDELVSDRSVRERVGRAGRDLVVNQFSLTQYAPRMLEILRAVAAGRAIVGEEIGTTRLTRTAQPDVS